MSRHLPRLGFAAAVLCSVAVAVCEANAASRGEEINALLKRFKANPREVMNAPLQRWDEKDRPTTPGDPANLRFSPEAIRSGEAIAARDRLRSGLCMRQQGKMKCLGEKLGALAQIEGSDRPEDLTDNGEAGFVRSLEKLEALNLQNVTLPVKPWSSDYWAYYRGVIAARYADERYPADYDWYTNHSYILRHTPESIARSEIPEKVNLLSPAEKYDLLIGDESFSLTRSMWAMGKQSMTDGGIVPSWMGICNGWANASFMVARPANGIVVPSADGRHNLRFYPDDIKALASLLWADGDFPVRFIGGRCRITEPETDSNGRIINRKCFDTNPGTFHLAVTNQLGISRRSLVMDATYDYEVWNHPIFRYRYSYFNPQSGKDVKTLEEARVPMARFTKDWFRRYRSQNAANVVGIAMDLSYRVESIPVHDRTDSPQDDIYKTVRYAYDLELDESGNIIGGEWYTNRHPDFLFVPEPGARARSPFEKVADGGWAPGEVMPESWRFAGREAGREGIPLAKIVEALVEKSVNANPTDE